MADETTHQHLSVDSAPTALILFLGRNASREEPTCFVVVVFANRIVDGLDLPERIWQVWPKNRHSLRILTFYVLS